MPNRKAPAKHRPLPSEPYRVPSTSAPGGRFIAQETGLGNASGPAYRTPSGTFRIDYVTRDGVIKGYYEVRFSPDGRTASGEVRELTGPMRSGPTNWARVTRGGPEVILFKLQSIAAVTQPPGRETIFPLDRPAVITKIWTYHWNGGKGMAPGTIGLRNTVTGQMFGPWSVVATYHMFDSDAGAPGRRKETALRSCTGQSNPTCRFPQGPMR